MEEWNAPTLYELAKRDDELQTQLKSLRWCLGQLLALLIDEQTKTESGLLWLQSEFHKLLVQVNQSESEES